MAKYIIAFIVISGNLFSQNLDSLYQKLLNLHSSTVNHKHSSVAQSETEKCTFGLANTILQRINEFSLEKQTEIKNILSRPNTDTSIVSPSGKFRIHFYKTGFNKPGYDIQQLAVAADSSYNYEVNVLGYPPHLSDGNSGGDDKYDIYIQNLSVGLYGTTYVENEVSADRFTAYTIIDNDFSQGYNTLGIDGARVTIAHEYHHAIQLGNYGFRSEDEFYYEITSTSMEEFVFDSINDYYYEAQYYFARPDKSLPNNNGYNLAVWNIYLKDRFGINIIKSIWESMRTKRAIASMENVIAAKESSLRSEFSKFGLWSFFTGKRAIPGKYFKEAANYPEITPLMIYEISNTTQKISVNSQPLSNNFLIFNDNGSSPRNEIVSIITNGDSESAQKSNLPSILFNYNLAVKQQNGYRKIIDGYYSYLESVNMAFLAEINIFNSVPVNEGGIIAQQIDYVYPQPFHYSKHNQLFFPVAEAGVFEAQLNIYSIDMNLIFSDSRRVIGGDKLVVLWDGIDSSGKKAATGVYIFATEINGKVTKGKFVIFND